MNVQAVLICMRIYIYIYIKLMRWAGHVTRMEEMRSAYNILVGKPEENKPLGKT
jgi:hypothetical protein